VITYDVLILTLSGVLLAHGSFEVPAGDLSWTFFYPCPRCENVLEVMLTPPEKFLNFEGGKYVGPGALGFPNGIIPCNKYEVVEGGVKYLVCAHKNVIVYERYLKDFAVQVSLKPTLKALELVPFVTDPASPGSKAIVSFLAALIATFSAVAFLKRHELVVM